MNDLASVQSDDLFSDSDEWIAALVRQFVRATDAKDAIASEVSAFYLKGYLVKLLGKHLHLAKDQRWVSFNGWLDQLGGALPVQEVPGRLLLCDEMTWATKDYKYWYLDPFEFEIELCPVSGTFRRYTIRFADNRPLCVKEFRSSVETTSGVGPGDTGWAFVYYRGGKGKE